ncbi:hypothetical protein RHSIM_Rhsim03G0020100 [Rhododendron simsii]|uniref:Uncharacterized protein n=1 Tax=Rhododendron simsii TaxID=118357 RepID=A0A834H5T5_RHOSS|nr:hypothetical protein RHSIM_Rhsim03G0020100 [Rhododendron simsii]
MAKAIFPRSSANVKTWVSDKMAKDLNSSAPVEFSVLANTKGIPQLPGEGERCGSESGLRTEVSATMLALASVGVLVSMTFSRVYPTWGEGSVP